MPAQWTADVIGEMHLKKIKAKQLAEVIGWNAKYLSQVLNGHVAPKNAEIKVRTALAKIIANEQTTALPEHPQNSTSNVR